MGKQQHIETYKQTVNSDSSEQVVKQYSHLVKKIAYHLLSRLPSSVQLEDLVQSGLIGLLEAKQNYDESKAASFETFASIRIRGAMLDDLRKMSWVPRSTYQNMRKIKEAIQNVENRIGTQATSRDIAKELGISVQEYGELLSAANAYELVSFDVVHEETIAEESEYGDPYQQTLLQDLKTNIVEVIKDFPEREQVILNMYYTDKLNFKDIGKVLNITEARVSQLHSQAIARLQAQLG